MFGAYLDVSKWPEERALACVRAAECEIATGDPFDPARVVRAVEWCRRAQKETPERFEPLYAEAKIWAIPGMTGDEASLATAVRAAARALRTPDTRTAMATRPLDRRLRVHEMLRVAHDLMCDWPGALRATEEAVKVRPADPALKLALKRYRALSKVAAVEEAKGMDIVFVCGPAAEPFNPALYEQRGMGGSETAVIEMARELAKRGHRVRVYCDCGFEGTFDGVDYLDVRAEYPPDQCDVIVAWRSYLNARFMHSAVRVVWAHDTRVVDMEKRDGRYEVAIDRVFALSEWHKANLCRVHELDPAGVWVTRNGISTDRFVNPGGAKIERNPHKAVYSSSPDRGLAALLDMWPRIRAKVPGAELHVYYGFEGWDRAVEQRGNPHERYLVRQMKERLTTTPGVTLRGLVSQTELARAMLSAGVMIYPTWYDETSMISAMEATAAGLRFIGTSRGALPETVGNRGLLIEGDWLDDDFQRQFVVAASVAMLNEDDAGTGSPSPATRASTSRGAGWRRSGRGVRAPDGRRGPARLEVDVRVLVTGGAGFIGSHPIDRLVERGDDVICVDNFYTGRKQNIERWLSLEVIRHDVCFPLYVEVDRIMNLACPASPKWYQKDPVQTMKTSVHGAINLLGLAKRTGARILQASTSEVYGDPEVHPQPEEYVGHVNPIGNRSCYDEGKRAAETLFFDYRRQHGVDARVVRIFNTYGPRMAEDDGRVVSNFIVRALRGEPLVIHGRGGVQTRSFCYVDDLVEGLLRAIDAPEMTEPVNLGNPEEISVSELAGQGAGADGVGLTPTSTRWRRWSRRPEAPEARHRAGEGAARLGAEGRARRGPDADDRVLQEGDQVMSKWKNNGAAELIFGQHIVQPGQTMEVDDERDVEVEAIAGFVREGAVREAPVARRRGVDPGFGLGRNPGSDADTGKGDE